MILRAVFLLLPLAACLLLTPHAHANSWPLYPDSTSHGISALYGMWLQNPGFEPFMHSGIDIPAPFYTPVYASESGYVKTITTRFDHYSYWRLAISPTAGEEECDAWIYAHILAATVPFEPGDWVNEGDFIGYIVDWPYHPNTSPHLHVSICRYAGTAEEWAAGVEDWLYVANPLDYLPLDNDTLPPVLENAYGSQLLAFCGNDNSIYFNEGDPVSGNVDIIARAYDRHNWLGLESVPYSVEYKIDGPSSVPWTMSACFTDPIGLFDELYKYALVVYKDDETCDSYIDENDRNSFYFVLTNTDGDTLVEQSDADLSWITGDFNNGDYQISVRIRDKSGNEDIDSMTVTVENYFDLTGSFDMSDGKPYRGIISIASMAETDTSEADGSFAMAQVPGGPQQLRAARLGYAEKDTTIIMNQTKHLDLVLEPCPYLRGDPNDDGNLNVGDAVFIINYVFKGGSAPDPTNAGDANCDGSVNVGDAVFMINYVFKGGLAPCPDCLY